MKHTVGEQLSNLLEVLPDAVIVVDDGGRIVFANPAVKPLLGYDIAELIGEPLSCLLPGAQRAQHEQQVAQFLTSGEATRMSARPVLQALHRSGIVIPVTVALARLDRDGAHYAVAVIRDAKPIRDHIGAVLAKAEADPLTGLANREALLRRVGELIAARQGLSLLFLDLQRFKPFNDLHGHRIGDEVLRIVARRIKALLRTEDLAARMGGDEFVVLFKGVDEQELLQVRAREIADRLCRPFQFEGIHGSVGLNIGGAIYPSDGRTGTELLEVADRRMYHAKRRNLSYCISDDVCSEF